MIPRKTNPNMTLYCFSPPVMLATFIIELLLAIYVRTKYGTSRLSQLIIYTLVCLAIFQGVEYRICELGGATIWVQIGLVAITLLPPLGIHIVAVLSGLKRFVITSYLLGFAYIGAFFLVTNYVQGATCGGNYVILETLPTTMYGVYYGLLLMLGVFEAWQARRLPHVSAANKAALGWLIVGYASFMAPLAVVYLVAPATRNGVASIMCGFAVILAFILAFRVMALGEPDGQKPDKKQK